MDRLTYRGGVPNAPVPHDPRRPAPGGGPAAGDSSATDTGAPANGPGVRATPGPPTVTPRVTPKSVPKPGPQSAKGTDSRGITKAPGKAPGKPTGKPTATAAKPGSAKPAKVATPGQATGSAAATGKPVRRLTRVEETSAGGLILDRGPEGPRAALIARRDRRGRLVWSLPKGHIESGETSQQAAVREVREETGISGEILAELGVIDFWFVAEDRRVHKTVHHYLMEATGGELSDEDIEVAEVAWVPLDQVPSRLAHAAERRLIALVPDLLDPAG